MTTRKPLNIVSGVVREIATGDTVDPALLATGTRDGSKFLRDDGTWSVAGSATKVQTVLSLTVPAQTINVGTVSISFSATSALVSQSIASFLVTWWDGSTQTVTATANTGTASKAIVGGVVGDVKYISVSATDSLGNVGTAVSRSTTLVANTPPSGTLTVSAPTTVATSSTGNQISFSGITDADAGDSITYTITGTGVFTSFSKTSGITSGEVITFSAPSVSSDTASSISVKAVDTYGGETAVTTTNITVIAAIIVGVVLKTTGGGGGTWSHIDAAGADIADPGTSWFNASAPWSGIADQTIDSQAMVKIPKFWYKVAAISSGANNGKTGWWISNAAASGFTLHPAFMAGGSAIDQFWYGKYQASLQSTKLASVSGVLPSVSRSLTQFQTDANARNTGGVTGFMVHSFWQWSAVQWLYLVENKTMDSQTKTGQGNVTSGSLANVDAVSTSQATYRGMVGLWGNIHQWLDGIRTIVTSGNVETWDISGNKTFTATGQTITTSTRYALTFVNAGAPDLAAGFIPSTWGATAASGTTPDFQSYSIANTYYPIVGGNFSDNTSAGLWSNHLDNLASYSGASTGSRLAKV